MPSEEVREMYAVPAANSRYSSESDGTNVDNSMDVSRTVELENELNEFLTNLSRDEGYEDNDSNTDMVEDRTVPLEDNVADVINNNSNNNNNNPSSPTNSIDLADAMSVASAQNTPAGHAHGTFGENDASIQDSGSKLFDDSGSNNDVDRTVELEVSDFLIICYITLNQTNPNKTKLHTIHAGRPKLPPRDDAKPRQAGRQFHLHPPRPLPSPLLDSDEGRQRSPP